MQKVVTDMLQDIAQEKNGYSIGEPWRFTEHSLAAVVPLTREGAEDRTYRLLSERKDEVQVKDIGNIERLTLLSKSEFPILVKAGEVVTGSTQSRTITISQVVMPGEKLSVPCACVYSSKGIMEGQRMTPTSFSPIDVRRRVLRGHYERSASGPSWGILSPGLYHRDQGEIWGGVKEFSTKSTARTRGLAAFAASHEIPEVDLEKLTQTFHTPSEDLAGRVSESQNKYKDILKKVPRVDHQVGIVLLTMSGLESMEAFEHPDSWEGIRRAILGAEAGTIADVSDQNGLFEFRAERSKGIIQELLGQAFNEKVAADRERTKTLILDAPQFVGELVTLDDKPIHLSFVRKDG